VYSIQGLNPPGLILRCCGPRHPIPVPAWGRERGSERRMCADFQPLCGCSKAALLSFCFFPPYTGIGLEKLNTIEFSGNPCEKLKRRAPKSMWHGGLWGKRGSGNSICHSFITHNIRGDCSPVFLFLFLYFLCFFPRPSLQSRSCCMAAC